MFNPTVVGVRQSSDKIPGLSKTMELCLNFCMRFYITYSVLTNYNKSAFNFILTTLATITTNLGYDQGSSFQFLKFSLSKILFISSYWHKYVYRKAYCYTWNCRKRQFPLFLQQYQSNTIGFCKFFFCVEHIFITLWILIRYMCDFFHISFILSFLYVLSCSTFC